MQADASQRPEARGRLITGRLGVWLVVLPALLTAALVNLPLVYVFIRAFEPGFRSFFSTVSTPSTFRLLGHTLLLVGGVVLLANLIAVPLAWLVVRTNLPGRRLWALLGALPLVFPSYVSALCLVAVLGPRGYLQRWLGVERIPSFIYGYGGALLALALFTYPYIYLLLVAALRNLDPSLEESSQTLGVGLGRTFWRVVLPQLRTPISTGSLLVGLYVLSDFGAVSIVRFNTLTLSIYNAYRTLFDRSVAASLASILVVLTVAFVAIEAWLSRHPTATRRRPARPAPTLALGGWMWPSILFVTLLAATTLGLPTAVLLSWGWESLASDGGLFGYWREAWSSLMVSGLAAVLAVVLSLPVVTWSLRSRRGLARWCERAIYAGYALPGIVMALALVFLVTRHLLPLYQTLALLVTAYVIRFLPQAAASSRSALAALSPTFEEAARTLGRSGFSIFRTVTWPLVRRGLLMGGSLVFLTSMKELPATLILRPIGFETLATRIWSPASEGIFSQAGAPALLLLIVTAPPVYWLLIRPVLSGRS